MSFKEIKDTIEKFEKIASTTKTNEKKELIKSFYKTTPPSFKDFLQFYLDPLSPTGLAAKKLLKTIDAAPSEKLETYTDVFNFLTGKEGSLKDADVKAVQNFISNYALYVNDEHSVKCLKKLLLRSWGELGIDAKTVNAVVPGAIYQHSVMLAESFKPEKFKMKHFMTQLKIDGFRTTIIKDNGNIKVLARSGKDLTGEFPEIEAAIKNLSFDNFVFDGDRVPIGFQNMTNEEMFKGTTESTTKGAKSGMCLAVYDMIPLNEWKAQKGVTPYAERYLNYTNLLKSEPSKFLVPIEHTSISIHGDLSVAYEDLKKAKENNQEGIMIKDLEAPYEWKRTSAITKFKVFNDIDLEVVDIEEGTGKYKGKLGAIVVSYKGFTVKVGSGFSDTQREEIWKNPKSIIGKTVELIYFEESKNKNGELSLRFPVFKCIKTGD